MYIVIPNHDIYLCFRLKFFTKFYTMGFLGQNFIHWKKRKLWLFLLSIEQRSQYKLLWSFFCWKVWTGLHKLWYPSIWDTSTWSKFGAHGEHGDVFLISNLGVLWFSENLIRYSLHVCLREVKNNLFSFKHSYLWHFSWRF